MYIADIIRKAARAVKGYPVTLRGYDALWLYDILTTEDRTGYRDLFPVFSERPSVNPDRYYMITVNDGYVHFDRNWRLSPMYEQVDETHWRVCQ